MGRSMASNVRTCSKSEDTKISIAHSRSSSRWQKHTVLHDITDNTEFIKVTTPTLCTERLLKCDLRQDRSVSKLPSIRSNPGISYLYIVDVLTVPSGVEEFVAEAHDKDVLDHLLTQIVVNSEDLLFLPVRFKGFLEVTRTLKVFTEGLLNLYATKSCASVIALPFGLWRETHDDPSNAVLGIAVLLQML